MSPLYDDDQTGFGGMGVAMSCMHQATSADKISPSFRLSRPSLDIKASKPTALGEIDVYA